MPYYRPHFHLIKTPLLSYQQSTIYLQTKASQTDKHELLFEYETHTNKKKNTFIVYRYVFQLTTHFATRISHRDRNLAVLMVDTRTYMQYDSNFELVWQHCFPPVHMA